MFASKLRGLVPGKEGCSQDLATSQVQGGGLLVPEQEDLMAGVWFLTLSRHQEACWTQVPADTVDKPVERDTCGSQNWFSVHP